MTPQARRRAACKFGTRFLLAALFLYIGGLVGREAFFASEAARLEREYPALERRLLSEEKRTELRQALAGGQQNGRVISGRAIPELAEGLQAAGLQPDLVGFVHILTEPIDSGEARRDLVQAVFRMLVLPDCGALYVSADGSMAIAYLGDPAAPRFADIYENREGTLHNSLLELSAPPDRTPTQTHTQP